MKIQNISPYRSSWNGSREVAVVEQNNVQPKTEKTPEISEEVAHLNEALLFDEH